MLDDEESVVADRQDLGGAAVVRAGPVHALDPVGDARQLAGGCAGCGVQLDEAVHVAARSAAVGRSSGQPRVNPSTGGSAHRLPGVEE
jgi:hypothetical protein